MEQRTLRLGDLVDDYCPRERRITNHAIVAIVNDTIRQTRCTTCDAEHVFKDGKIPKRRPKPGASAEPVDNTGGQLVPPRPDPALDAPPAITTPDDAPAEAAQATDESAVPPDTDAADAADEVSDAHDFAWPANRTLIRATLPRQEGDVPPPRPIPEFTMHQRQNGRGGFRHGRGGGGGWFDQGNGNGRNGSRGGGDNRGNQAPGFGGQGHGGRRRHGKKRPR
jgi:hypothetical protein